MTDLSRIDSDDEQGDAWLDAYPPQHRAMLEKYGVPTWMNQRADAHNRRLIAVVDAGCSRRPSSRRLPSRASTSTSATRSPTGPPKRQLHGETTPLGMLISTRRTRSQLPTVSATS